MHSFFQTIFSLLVILLSFTFGCSESKKPGPVMINSINTIEDLIRSKCMQGFDLVVLPGQSPIIQQGISMPGEKPPTRGTLGRDKVFANDKLIACNEKQKIRLISLTYVISATRVYPPNKKEPLPLFDNGKFIIKAISISDIGRKTSVKATPLSSPNMAKLEITLGTNFLMQKKTRKVTFTGLFPTTPGLDGDLYATIITKVEAVDDNAPPSKKDVRLKFFILGEENYEIQISTSSQ